MPTFHGLQACSCSFASPPAEQMRTFNFTYFHLHAWCMVHVGLSFLGVCVGGGGGGFTSVYTYIYTSPTIIH